MVPMRWDEGGGPGQIPPQFCPQCPNHLAPSSPWSDRQLMLCAWLRLAWLFNPAGWPNLQLLGIVSLHGEKVVLIQEKHIFQTLKLIFPTNF